MCCQVSPEHLLGLILQWISHCSSLLSQRRGHGALPAGEKQLQVCKVSPGVPDPALPHRPGKALPAPLSHPAAASARRARRWQRGDSPDGSVGSGRCPQPRAASRLPARETNAPPDRVGRRGPIAATRAPERGGAVPITLEPFAGRTGPGRVNPAGLSPDRAARSSLRSGPDEARERCESHITTKGRG